MVILTKLILDYDTDYDKIVYTIHHEFRSIAARFNGLMVLTVKEDHEFYAQWVALFDVWRSDSTYLHYSYVEPRENKYGHESIMKDIQRLLGKNLATLEGLYAHTFPDRDMSNEFFIYWTATRLEASRLLRELNNYNYYKKAN